MQRNIAPLTAALLPGLVAGNTWAQEPVQNEGEQTRLLNYENMPGADGNGGRRFSFDFSGAEVICSLFLAGTDNGGYAYSCWPIPTETCPCAERFHTGFSRGEEIAHAITHGIGALGSVLGLVLLVVRAAERGGALLITGVTIFGVSMVVLYLASTLYHALVPHRAKRVFELMDHAAIYLLIAGSYTPFTLVVLGGGWGWTLFGVSWGLAVLGILYEVVLMRPSKKLSLMFYLLLGWLAVFAVKPLLSAMPSAALALMGAGGVAYTAGAFFYAWRGFRYHHAIWHLFVVAGTACHFLCVLWYVIPAY